MTTATPHLPAINPERVDADSTIAPMLEFIRTASGGRLAITDGRSSGEGKVDALLEVVREAAGADGTVSGFPWAAAIEVGWTTGELTETYGYPALVAYCDRFVRYTRIEFDLAFATIAS